jgi:hypothetical protein
MFRAAARTAFFLSLTIILSSTIYFPMVGDSFGRGGEPPTAAPTFTVPTSPPTPLVTPTEWAVNKNAQVRFVSPRADYGTWCTLQGIDCYVLELDPAFRFVTPAGYAAKSLNVWSGQTRTYYVFPYLTGCFFRQDVSPAEGLCAQGGDWLVEISRVWEAPVIDVITVFLEKTG